MVVGIIWEAQEPVGSFWPPPQARVIMTILTAGEIESNHTPTQYLWGAPVGGELSVEKDLIV
jgi:hypothetical protein